MIVVLPGNDLVGSLDDGISVGGIDDAKFFVDDSGGALNLRECDNLGGFKASARNREVFYGALGLCPIQCVLGDSNLTHGVVFDAVFLVGGARHALFPFV